MSKMHYIIIAVILVIGFAVVAWFMAASAPVPQVGTQAPAFSLPNQKGDTVSLQGLRGKWVVLYFYPKDFTQGCSIEAHNFQADIKKYIALNAEVVGVSVDTVDSHKSFCTKEGLNFLLLSDAQGTVSKSYGSIMNIVGKTLAARNTFLIDPSGMIRKVYMKVTPAMHSDEVLATLAQLSKTSAK